MAELEVPTQEPKPKKSAQEFAAAIKAKYPAYKDVDDIELANKMIAKYPQYKEQVQFDTPEKKRDVGGPESKLLPEQPTKVSDIPTPTSPAIKDPDQGIAGMFKGTINYVPQPTGPDKVTDPIETAGKSLWNVFAYQLPTSTAAIGAAGAGIIPDIGQQVRERYLRPSPEEQARLMSTGTPEEIEAAYNIERTEKGKKIKQAQQEMFAWAMQHQEKGAKFTEGLTSELGKIEGPLDALNWFSYAVGQAAGQIPLAIGTMGASGAIQEVGEVYMGGVREIAEKHGITPQEVIERGMDDPATAAAYGLAAASLEYVGARGVGKQITKSGLAKDLARRGLAIIKAGGGESLTEGAQTILEQAGAQVSGGKSVFDTDIDWKEVLEAAAQGAVGGGVITGGAGAAQGTTEPNAKATPEQMEVNAQALNQEVIKKVADESGPQPEIRIEAPVGDLGTLEAEVLAEPAPTPPTPAAPAPAVKPEISAPKQVPGTPAAKQELKPKKDKVTTKKKTDAIQKPSPAKVPVQPEAKAGEKVEPKVSKPEKPTGKGKLKAKPKEEVVYTATTADGTITRDEQGTLTFKNKKGKPVSLPTQRKIADEYASSEEVQNKPFIEPPTEQGWATELDEYNQVASESVNPNEIAMTFEKVDQMPDDISFKDETIKDNLKGVNGKDFDHYMDKNQRGANLGKSYFDKKAAPLDTQAQEMSEIAGVEITEQDIVDHVLKYPGKSNYDPAKRKLKKALSDQYEEQFGRALTPAVAKKMLAEDQGVTKQEGSVFEKFDDIFAPTNVPTAEQIAEAEAIFGPTVTTEQDEAAQKATEEEAPKPAKEVPAKREGKKGDEPGVRVPGEKKRPQKLKAKPEKQFIEKLEPGDIVFDQAGNQFIVKGTDKNTVYGEDAQTGRQRDLANTKSGKLAEGIVQRRLRPKKHGQTTIKLPSTGPKPKKQQPGKLQARPITKVDKEGPTQEGFTRPKRLTPKNKSAMARIAEGAFNISKTDGAKVADYVDQAAIRWGKNHGLKKSDMYQTMVIQMGDNLNNFLDTVNKDTGQPVPADLKSIQPSKHRKPRADPQNGGPALGMMMPGEGVTLNVDALAPALTIKLQDFRRWVKKNFTSAGLLTKESFERANKKNYRIDSRTRQIEFVQKDLLAAIKEDVGRKNLTIEQTELINAVLKGEESTAFLNDMPNVQAVVKRMRADVDTLSNELIDSDILSSGLSESVADNLGLYLNRSYRIHDMGTKWQRFLKNDPQGQKIVDKTVTHFANQQQSKIDKNNQTAGFLENLTLDQAKELHYHTVFAQKIKEQPDAEKTQLAAQAMREAEISFSYSGMKKKAMTQAKKHRESAVALAKRDPVADVAALVQEHVQPVPFIKGGKLGSKDLGILKQRLNLSPEVRELLGEYNDPLINYAKSVTKLSVMLENQYFLEEIKVMGQNEGWLTETNNRENTVKLAAEGNLSMAPLDGLWTTPDMAEAFTQMDESANQHAIKMVLSAMSLAKTAKTVGSVKTHFRNFFGNYLFAVANGHMSPLRAHKVGKAGKSLGDALKLVFQDFANSRSPEARARIKEYMRLGLIGQDVRGGELRALLGDINQDVTKQESVGDALDKSNVKGLAKRITKGATKAYQLEDALWKIVAYETELSRYTKAFQDNHNYVTTKGVPTEQLKQYASDIVLDTYPTYAKVPEAVKALRRIPIIGSFVAFPSEVVRTTKNVAKQAHKEMTSSNPEIKKIGYQRAFGLVQATALTSGLSYASMLLVGVSFEEDDELDKFVAPWAKGGSRIYFGKEPGGGYNYIDIGYTDPYDMINRPIRRMLGGDLAERPYETMKEIMWDFGEPFLGEDLVFQRYTDVMRNKEKDSGKRIYFETDSDWTKLKKIGGHFTDPFIPGTITDAKRILESFEQRGEEVSRYGRRKDPLIEISSLSGFRLEPLEVNQSLFFNMLGFNANLTDARSFYNTEVKRKGGKPEEAFVEYNRRRNNILFEMREHINGALILNVDERDIKETLKLSNVPTKYHRYLFGKTGKLPKLKKSKK